MGPRYLPQAGDTTRWLPGTGFGLDGIGHADCACGDVAGFTLRVDAVTGEVLRASPGIDCAVG